MRGASQLVVDHVGLKKSEAGLDRSLRGVMPVRTPRAHWSDDGYEPADSLSDTSRQAWRAGAGAAKTSEEGIRRGDWVEACGMGSFAAAGVPNDLRGKPQGQYRQHETAWQPQGRRQE